MIKNLSKLFLVVICLGLLGSFRVLAATDAKEVVTDAWCARDILTGSAMDPGTDPKSTTYNQPLCNSLCEWGILFDGDGTRNGAFCKYGSTSERGTINGSNYLPDANVPIGAPPNDQIMIYARGAIYAVMGLVGLGVILLGLYGWYLRAMSEGNPEKVEESMKIYKNAIIGAIIVFVSVIGVQMTFVLLGVTENVLDFNAIPKYGYKVQVTENDAGRFCYDTQIDKSDLGGFFVCKDNKWVKQ